MLLILKVAAIFCVSIAWAQSLAHALELPGKLRLGREAYIATQTIYYPGFTIAAGFGEGLGMVLTLALLLQTGTASPAFGWTLVALLALLAMHGLYWLVTHPVNKFWLKDQDLKGLGAGFFAIGGERPDARADEDPDRLWRKLRDRWEYSHVVRALLAGLAMIALTISVAI